MAAKSPVVIPVPFMVQAPFGNWHDERQLNACEEMSVIMVMQWLRGQRTIRAHDAHDLVQSMALYQEDRYGSHEDTSLEDTAIRLVQGYFQYRNFSVQAIVTPADLVAELERGNPLIVAVNGRILANPHFRPPGPERHTLVLLGHDPERGEFITNDPGTRYGALYRYPVARFFQAIQDYPSGRQRQRKQLVRRVLIVRPPQAKDLLSPLLDQARGAVRSAWEGGAAPGPLDQSAAGGGIYVRFCTSTLVERGCLSLFRNVRDFQAAARTAAWTAAFRDDRYKALDKAEAPDLFLELGLIGLWQGARDLASIDIYHQMVYMMHPRATVMMQPSVVIDRGWNHQELAEALCRKGGLERGAWRDPAVRWQFAPVDYRREAF